ncbi:MAG: nucleotide sugar dehydrogenase [Chloroflexota bacterium]|nr:nucleotide sugar dehydrogenase [Chloroflexota bacterium]
MSTPLIAPEQTQTTELDQLSNLIATKQARIGVVGLGYVGLPLAVEFAKAGFLVTGIDVNSQRADGISQGHSHILDVPPRVLASLVTAGVLRATDNFEVVSKLDVVFICVPTPHDAAKAPDLSYIRAASLEIGKRLRQGQLIILESTTYPGTTEEVMLPLLEQSGLRPGIDFAVAFSPERVDPGNKLFDTRTTPKVVGGLTPHCAELTKQVFEQIIEGDGQAVHIVSSPRAAEMTKLLENCFRSVNIALVNEMALLCDRMGINIWEVIDAAATKPFGFMPFYPGPGVGGHCIPVDPYYLSWKAREFDFYTKFIELAAETNLSMPFHVVSKIAEALNGQEKSLRDSRLLVLGAAFKKDVNDARNSPALRVMELLLKEGAHVQYHDPYIPCVSVGLGVFSRKSRDIELTSIELTAAALQEADCVVVTVAHSAYDFDWVVDHAALVVDTVNATKRVARFRDKIVLI